MLKFFRERKDRPGQYQTMCIPCNKEYQRQHYQENKRSYVKKASAYKNEMRALVVEAKDRPCTDCGKRFHVCQMDLDHVEGKKRFLLSKAHFNRGRTQILAELSKCEAVCSNCHRLRTHTRKHGPIV